MDNSSRPPPQEERWNGTRVWLERLRFFSRPRRIALICSALLLGGVAVSAHWLLKNRRQGNGMHDKAELPPPAPAPPPPKFREIVDSFQPNQTITQALLKQGLSHALISQIVDSARPVYDLAKVKARQSYWIYFTEDGKFRDFRYPVDDTRYLTVYHDVAQDRLVPVMKEFQFETRVHVASAEIESSLFSSVMDIGEQDQLALDLAEVFSSDIDFNTDIQKGDSFRVLVEKKYLDGRFTKYGAILAAAMVNQKKQLLGYRFEDENGKPAYYDPDGKALKRSFLKSPLKYARITSRFSRRRYHPILKVVRPHLGVDYAAPIGTPVQAVGAGVIVSAGRSGANGKMVRIRHAGGYETMYLHLSRISVRSGTRVSQGEVIGNVGSTGLSTGPHLDFRILRHGVAVNPTKVIFPPGKPVSPDQFDRFAALRDKLNYELRVTNDELKQAAAPGNPPR